MYRPVDVIEVRIWDRTVGAVALDPKLGYYAFEYDPAFARSGIELAPLTMPLAAARDPFIFPALSERTWLRLPALLADALPDDFGNALVDAWMSRHGVARDAITPLDRLAYMGKRGLGALEFRPARSPAITSATAIKLSELVESARLAVRGDLASDAHAAAALTQLIRVGTSAGGARAKAVIAWNPATDEIRPGQFEVAEGFEHWLLKFDGLGPDPELGSSQAYGRIEYAYHLMATAAGIAMSPCRLIEEHGRAHFMTKRFDRTGNRKHHLQTLCAMSHLDYRQKATHDAAQLFQTLAQLHLDHAAFDESFRRLAFNIMSANCDDHTKNTSFLLREDEAWQLAPAYDLTHAFNPQGEWTNQHLLGVNGKFTGIASDDLLKLADRFAIGAAPRLMKEVAAAVAAWPDFAARAGVGEAETARIRGDHRLLKG
jgi:serine/threonine-protein kinase HipA